MINDEYFGEGIFVIVYTLGKLSIWGRKNIYLDSIVYLFLTLTEIARLADLKKRWIDMESIIDQKKHNWYARQRINLLFSYYSAYQIKRTLARRIRSHIS